MTSSENGRVERLVFPDQDDERRLWESVVGHATLWVAPICGLCCSCGPPTGSGPVRPRAASDVRAALGIH